MSSIHSHINQMPANVLYYALADLSGTLYNEAGAVLGIGSRTTYSMTQGSIYRDMGKAIGPLRKVQMVPADAAVGGAAADNFLTCYIKVGANGTTGATPVARMC